METKSNAETKKELSEKILKLSMKIKEQHPELSKYIEEMPVTIPDEKNPEITVDNLHAYFQSLNVLLKKYISEHADQGK